MKIERIDENQIRCILTSEDLAARQLSLQDLAYGSDKARTLFQEMMMKAVNEMNFEVDGIPLMIEAVPLNSDGIMLIITRVEDPEELDTRFSRFTQPSGEPAEFPSEDSPSKSGMSSLLTTLKRYIESQTSELADEVRCFRFESMSGLIHGCQAIRNVFKGGSTLYKGPDKCYYLFLFRECSVDDFNLLTTTLSEFGHRTMSGVGTPSYFEEHYDRLIESMAVESLGGIE